MIRTLAVLAWWGFWTLLNGIWGIPWMYMTGRIDGLYRSAMWGARTGVKLAGAKLEVRGRDHVQIGRAHV